MKKGVNWDKFRQSIQMTKWKILAYNCKKILFDCKKGWIETNSDKVYKNQSEKFSL